MQSDDTARIPLRALDGSVRAYAIIDADLAEWANQWRWALSSHGYAARYTRIGNRKKHCVFLHREILGLVRGDGIEGDHISQDKLDNRRANLRAVSKPANRQNVPSRSGASSRFRGVTWNKALKKWQAGVRTGGKQIYLGVYSNESDAAAAARAGRAKYLPFAVD